MTEDFRAPAELPALCHEGEVNVYRELNKNLTFHGNLGVAVVATTRDKIENVLLRLLPKYELRRAWYAPFGVLASLLVTLATAQFQDFLGIPGQIIHGAFIVAAVFLGYRWIKALVQHRKSVDLDDIVEAIVKTHDPTPKRTIRG